ncbi:NAD(P)H-dependent glycerol-3-phosphate dehydrogenase, partial [Rubrivirga sp.]|uniref:NAD(P)H-dependent glycerol-3-phosphate dehydrogenase n=1 Tax=Rubrivirga sp. TaxID=1885344 RepID=UPI003C764E5B
MHHFNHIGVIGAGAWGTALAETAARAGRDVTLWAYEKDVVATINDFQENTSFLPGIKLHSSISATNDMAKAFETDAVLLVPPAQKMEAVLKPLADQCKNKDVPPLIICSKGIEISTGRLMSQVVSALFPNAVIGALSGPSFAGEMAEGHPTAVTLAINENHADMGYELCEALATPQFRPYLAHDVIGTQIGGAIKNVLAIACGIAAGRGLGDNTRAAIITRGLAEMTRFGQAMGADPVTFHGLSGLGDLTLT